MKFEDPSKKISLIDNMPSDEILKKWQEVVKDYTDVEFPLEVIKMAFILDIGYRAGMMRFSPHYNEPDKLDPYKGSIKYWTSRKGGWFEDIDCDTALREDIIEKCFILKYGLEYPMYGNSDEYKELFYMTVYGEHYDKNK